MKLLIRHIDFYTIYSIHSHSHLNIPEKRDFLFQHDDTFSMQHEKNYHTTVFYLHLIIRFEKFFSMRWKSDK